MILEPGQQGAKILVLSWFLLCRIIIQESNVQLCMVIAKSLCVFKIRGPDVFSLTRKAVPSYKILIFLSRDY